VHAGELEADQFLLKYHKPGVQPGDLIFYYHSVMPVLRLPVFILFASALEQKTVKTQYAPASL